MSTLRRVSIRGRIATSLARRLGVPTSAEREKASRSAAGLRAEIKVLRKRLGYLETVLLEVGENQRRSVEIARNALAPQVSGHNFVRIGSRHDGGYIFAEDVATEWVLSIGVGNNNEADIDFAERGLPVTCFDHTIESLPMNHPNIAFYRTGLGYGEENLISLRQMVALSDSTGGDGILAMDVEGAEWAALGDDVTNAESLRRFSQVSVELHGLHRLADPTVADRILHVLSQLTEHHVSVALSANNYEPTIMISGIPVPDTLEVLLIRRDRFLAGDRLPARVLNSPNNPNRVFEDPNPFNVRCWD